MQNGTIFDIKKYSINDGPGIRTTVFLNGCPLSCLWCHNPESQSLKPQLLYRAQRCLGCGTCVEACPENAISLESRSSTSGIASDSRSSTSGVVSESRSSTSGIASDSRSSTSGVVLESRSSTSGVVSESRNSTSGVASESRNSTSGKVITDRNKCTRCQTCIATCYSGAREFSGRQVTVGEVMAQIEREIPFYDESGGGVTFSGGEPLMQPGFLSALLKACREQEIHTIVDTSGFANWNVFEQIRGDVDLFLYDLKHMDSTHHRRVTGVPNEGILENLRRLSAAGAKCIVRIPLIPGINDDENNLIESGKFLASLPRIEGVELMGYHDIAQAKYEALGREYALAEIKPPTETEMNTAALLLQSYGLNVVLR